MATADELIARLSTADGGDRETMLALDPQLRDPQFLAAFVARALEEPSFAPIAREVLRSLLATDRQFLAGYVAVALRDADRLVSAGDLEAARATLHEIEQWARRLSSSAALVWVQLNAIRAAMSRSNHAGAVRAADQLVDLLSEDRTPDVSLPPLEALGDALTWAASSAYYELKDMKAVVRLASAALQLAPSELVVELLGFALMRSGRVEDARQLWQLMLSRSETPQRYFNLANCELKLGDREAAVAALRRAYELAPDGGHYGLHAALVLARLGRGDEAFALLDDAAARCERLIRDEPQRTLVLDGADVPLKEFVATTRIKIATRLFEHGDVARARRVLEAMLRTDDADTAAAVHISLSVIENRSGDAAAARAALDAALARAPERTPVRLASADWFLEAGEHDRAAAELSYLVRRQQDVGDAAERLEAILAAVPDHLAASTWLGCAYSFVDLENLDRGISILDRVLARDPSNGYARMRRALARITHRTYIPDWNPDQPFLSYRDVFEVIRELGVALRDAPGDADVRRAYHWLIDRLSADEQCLGWLLISAKAPGGIWTLAPGAVEALRSQLQAEQLGLQQRYRDAIALLEAAQRALAREDFPVAAVRVHLQLADNLMRLDELDGVAQHLDRFDETFAAVHGTPLTERLEHQAALRERRRVHLGKAGANLELEYLWVYTLAFGSVHLTRSLLIAELNARLGHAEQALAAVDAVETALRKQPRLEATDATRALHVVWLLRDLVGVPRAKAFLEHVRPHVPERQAPVADMTLATLHMQAGELEAAIALCERILSRGAELPAEYRKRAEQNLASCVSDSDPARARALLEPYLDDTSDTPSARAKLSVTAARCAHALGDRDAANRHARNALRAVAELRSAAARPDDRIAVLDNYDHIIAVALYLLHACGDAPGLFEAVEAIRARSLLDEIAGGERGDRDDDASIATQLAQVGRVVSGLHRLQRGLEQLGSGYVDAEALATVLAGEPQLVLFDEPDTGPRALSAERIARALRSAARVLKRLQAQHERLQAHTYEVASPDALRETLRAAAGPDERWTLATIIDTAMEVVVATLSSDGGGVQLHGTGVASEALSERLGGGGTVGDRIEACADLLQAALAPIVGATRPGDVIALCTAHPWATLPLHAVPLADGPFGARNPICYTPSAGVLAQCIASARTGRRPVVVGDPRGDLSKARDEARWVARCFGVAPILGAAATVERVLDELTDPDTAYVHLACHGDHDAERGLASALLLAPRDLLDDGRLTARTLAGVRLANARVVLSACDSGLGEARTAHELFGLPRALLRAGARSVVGTLWKASDVAAYFLIRELYRRLDGESTVRALAGAQAWLRARSVADLIASCDELLETELEPDARARVVLDRASCAILARDFAGARDQYVRIERECDPDSCAAELARARHALQLVEKRGDLPSDPDYERQPFAAIEQWAPFILIGDWR